MNGVNTENFTQNAIVLAAWKATVALACSPERPDLVRVDIVSVQDTATADFNSLQRRLVTTATAAVAAGKHTPERKYNNIEKKESHFHILVAVAVNFDVSYTLEDFNTNDANITTITLKSNYENSVNTQNFNKDFALEVQKRTVDSDPIINQIFPAEINLSSSYTIIKTTERPTYKPTAQPSSGKLNT